MSRKLIKGKINSLVDNKYKPESKSLSNDTAEEVDLLGFAPYVEAIAEFLTVEGDITSNYSFY